MVEKMATPAPNRSVISNGISGIVAAAECLFELKPMMDVALGALDTTTALGTAVVPVVISSMLVAVALKFVCAREISLLARS